MELLAERRIDVSKRTVLRWVQTFGPRLAAAVHKHRRRAGTTWHVDEIFFFRDGGKEQRYLYRAINEQGQVLDILFQGRRDTESATAFFRRTRGTTGTTPSTISDHHAPYVGAFLRKHKARQPPVPNGLRLHAAYSGCSDDAWPEESGIEPGKTRRSRGRAVCPRSPASVLRRGTWDGGAVLGQDAHAVRTARRR